MIMAATVPIAAYPMACIVFCHAVSWLTGTIFSVVSLLVFDVLSVLAVSVAW